LSAPDLQPSPGKQESETISSQDAPDSSTNHHSADAIPASPEISQPAEPLPASHHGLGYRLFSPQTRFGRAIRSILRWLAIIAGIFGLGLFTGFLLLYQPAQRDLADARQHLNQSEQALAQRQADLEQAQAGRENALKATNKAQAELKLAANKNQLLVVMVGVNTARIALLNKDGAAAKSAIEQAQLDLAKAAPFLETQDKNRSDVLKARLDLAGKELVSDPAAALADLDKLSTDLADLNKKLFPD
jgi:hypothetical protein